jgi:hypothetical protein
MRNGRNFGTRDGSREIEDVAIQLSKLKFENRSSKSETNSKLESTKFERDSNLSMPVAIRRAIWHRESKYVEVGCEY